MASHRFAVGALASTLLIGLVTLVSGALASAQRSGVSAAATVPAADCPAAVVVSSVPPYGSFELLRGSSVGLAPDAHRIALYIFVGGVWWTKPTLAQPTVPIQPDGSWTVDYTTGGVDEEATRFAVFAIPADYAPPPAMGAAALPAELVTRSAAYAVVDRDPPWPVIDFAGRRWRVKESQRPVGPGPNVFAAENVSVDSLGRLHLRLARGTPFTSAEVMSVEPFGYGVYTFTVASRIDILDLNVVLGLFTFDEGAPEAYFRAPEGVRSPEAHYRELDVELARWGQAAGPNAQFVVQPFDTPGNRHRFSLVQREITTTHVIDWQPNRVRFASFQESGGGPADLIDSYTVSGPAVPTEGAGRARINLWLDGGRPPSDGREVEVVIASFGFTPARSSGFHPRDLVLVDDYRTQPRAGEAGWGFDRLGAARGQIDLDGVPDQGVAWGRGGVTATVLAGMTAGKGVYSHLSPAADGRSGIDFSAIYPPQIDRSVQRRVTALRVTIAGGRGTFRLELKDPDECVVWRHTVALAGGPQVIRTANPLLGRIRTLTWLVTGPAGSHVTVERIELATEGVEADAEPGIDTARREFVRSYAMLLDNLDPVDNWDPDTGLTRDKAYEAAGQNDNVTASGLQAAAAVVAAELGVIDHDAAVDIVERTTAGLLALPRPVAGLWPHFVRGGARAPRAKLSSVDQVIAAVAVLEARQALALDTRAVEARLEDIDWSALIRSDGTIGHGFEPDKADEALVPIDAAWSDFGTESWLVNLAYAATAGRIAVFDHQPPTYNGSAFIDELAWLLLPPPSPDRAGTDWGAWRELAAERQVDYYGDATPGSECHVAAGLFGLSAAEVPDPSLAPMPGPTPGPTPDPENAIYQPFGVGGITAPWDGRQIPWLGHAVVVPHAAALLASVRPAEAEAMAESLADRGLATPLNHVESMMFTDDGGNGSVPTCQNVVWNELKGSLNLAFEVLGWGRLLIQRELGLEAHPLYRAAAANALLERGSAILRGEEDCVPQPPIPTPVEGVGHAGRALSGVNLDGWTTAAGDDGRETGPTSRCDLATYHFADRSLLLANILRRPFVAHNVTSLQVSDDQAGDVVHVCTLRLRIPDDPAGGDPTLGGEALGGHLALVDGARELRAGFQWLVDPNDSDRYGQVRVWSASAAAPGQPPAGGWIPVDHRQPDDRWHTVQLVVDPRAHSATVRLDGVPLPTQSSAVSEPSSWGPGVTARCAVEILSRQSDPTPGPGTAASAGSLHRLEVSDWRWQWLAPVYLPIAGTGSRSP